MIRRLLLRWGWIYPRWDELPLRDRLLVTTLRSAKWR